MGSLTPPAAVTRVSRLGPKSQRGSPRAGLEYEAYEALALKEGERIVAEALELFGVRRIACVSAGELAIGELAVWWV